MRCERAPKMAEAPASPAPLSPLEVELDPEFEPQSRPRSCTWPLQRPELQASPAKPPGDTAADSMIPEEEDDEDDEDGGGRAASAMAIGGVGVGGAGGVGVGGTLGSGLLLEDSSQLLAPGGQDLGPGPAPAAGALGGGTQTPPLQPQQPLAPPQSGAAGGSGQPRKCSSRRNAWGNLSYADLITRAIESSPDKRLTLSQIYEWMVRCVPYFKDKGDSNSSAGWKVRTRSPPGVGVEGRLAAGPAGPFVWRGMSLEWIRAHLRKGVRRGRRRGNWDGQGGGSLVKTRCGRGSCDPYLSRRRATQATAEAWGARAGARRGVSALAWSVGRAGRECGGWILRNGGKEVRRSAANFGTEFSVVGGGRGKVRRGAGSRG